MDCFIIKAIADEFNLNVSPIKITQIEQIASYTFIFKLYKEHKYRWLIFCADPNLSYCYLTETKPQNHDMNCCVSSPFLLALRKFLIGSLLKNIDTKSMERIFCFNLIPYQAGHEGTHLKLIFEMIGRKSNILIINKGDNEILDSLLPDSRRLYNFPQVPLNKRNPFEINIIELQETLKKSLEVTPDKKLSSLLVAGLFGISPIIAKEILFRSGIDDVKLNEGCDILDICSRLFNVLKEIIAHYQITTEIKNREAKYYFILYSKEEKPPILSTIVLKHLKEKVSILKFSNIIEATEIFYSDKIESLRVHKKKKLLLKFLKRVKKRYNLRLSKLIIDKTETQRSDEYRKIGDILMANLTKVNKGMQEIVLHNIYSNNENEKINISLDPTKKPVDNASLYYKRYKKTKRSTEIIKQRLNETREYLEFINKTEKEINQVNDDFGLDEISKGFNNINLPDRCISNKDKNDIQAKRKNKIISGVRRFLVEDKWEILVGKNNKANDYLTRIIAKSEDIWFHAYNTPGSHVILRNPTKQKVIPKNILIKTAQVAAFFSRQRNDDIATVGYTSRKYVRKTKNLKPGMVLVDCQKTMEVRPDASEIVSI